jgi:peptide subunit release factor 1 (eRF1)
MISLVIPPKDQVSRIVKMLADEYGTASNIKSRVNRFVNISSTLRICGASRFTVSKIVFD